MDIKQIGERVRQARTEKKMTQAQLAKALQVSAPFVSNIEQGKQTMSITVLCAICDVLDVSADWILRDSTPVARRMTDEEMTAIIGDCTHEEKTAMLEILRRIKEFMRIREN